MKAIYHEVKYQQIVDFKEFIAFTESLLRMKEHNLSHNPILGFHSAV